MRVSFAKPIVTLSIAAMALSACSIGERVGEFVPDFLKPNRSNGEVVVESAVLEGAPAPTEVEKPKDATPTPQNLGRITVADAAKTSTTEQQAARATASTGRSLGATVVSLGLLDETGFWLQTPLVTSETAGRVSYGFTGKSANVQLIPNGAAPGSGSQMSIATMQLLGIAITDLVEVQVFTR